MYIMTNKIPRLTEVITIISLGLCLTGCAATAQTKHLSSDVCLVMPESTTKAEVLSFLGDPDQKKTSPDGDETWYYHKENKDFIRTVPLIGEKLGTLNYETVAISFMGNKVRTCIYRQLNPAEFNNFSNDNQLEIQR